ncbi:MAG: heparan-alpha-glucosaminide N-acetyltransferase domain-containing protein [Actinomycetota bacterium]
MTTATAAPERAPAPPAGPAPDAPSTLLPRIGGLDLARAIAMAGMLVVHYMIPDRSGSLADTVLESFSGRAMPLFMVLGGIGATIVASRRTQPDLNLLIRAGILFAMGVALLEIDTWIAVVLQSYGLFFALTPLLRRVPTVWLSVLTGVVAVFGAWSFQTLTDFPSEITIDSYDEPFRSLWVLVFTGYYPLFPVASFFLLGMVLGRLPLRSARVATALASVGAVLTVVPLVASWVAQQVFDVFVPEGPRGFRESTGGWSPPFNPEAFDWARLLDASGHSEMPVWVLSAAGSSLLIIGLGILAGARWPAVTRPLEIVGRLALTFYVIQVLATNWLSEPWTQSLTQQAVTWAAIWFGFWIFAIAWHRWLGAGPLERLLRIGTRARSRSTA